MVTSASPYATAVGVQVLAQGGNAVDAAAAVAFTLAVAYPTAGNLGGGGFIVALINGEPVALDFRETAPGRASRDMYLDASGHVTDKSLTGALAAGVPGSVAGLWEAHRKYGTLPWAAVLAPAIALADSGFLADSAFVEDLAYDENRLRSFPTTKAVYLPNGARVGVGMRWRNPDLARTLARIAAQGRDGFYKGQTAALVARQMRQSGGLISEGDLARYQALWRKPVEFSYRGRRVVSMPPASSGGLTLALMANILGQRDMGALGWHSTASLVLTADASRAAFAKRNSLLGDPAFVDIPTSAFTSPDTARAIYARIRAGTRESVPARAGEPQHTTHLNVVDALGNAVAMTTTLNGGYGSALVVGGAGFLLNNEMDDFTTKVGVINAMGLRQGEANAIVPGKRMLSSMTPTIVLDSVGRVELVVGASGGARIITAVAQVLFGVVDYNKSLGDVMAAPRFHAQDYPDSLLLERGGYDSTFVTHLRAAGQKPALTTAWEYDFGWAQAIHRRDGRWNGVSEPRGHGLARGR